MNQDHQHNSSAPILAGILFGYWKQGPQAHSKDLVFPGLQPLKILIGRPHYYQFIILRSFIRWWRFSLVPCVCVLARGGGGGGVYACLYMWLCVRLPVCVRLRVLVCVCVRAWYTISKRTIKWNQQTLVSWNSTRSYKFHGKLCIVLCSPPKRGCWTTPTTNGSTSSTSRGSELSHISREPICHDLIHSNVEILLLTTPGLMMTAESPNLPLFLTTWTSECVVYQYKSLVLTLFELTSFKWAHAPKLLIRWSLRTMS